MEEKETDPIAILSADLEEMNQLKFALNLKIFMLKTRVEELEKALDDILETAWTH